MINTAQGKSVIVIDEHLKLKEPSFLKQNIKSFKVYVFKDFKMENYD
jgi:hypothetical protein